MLYKKCIRVETANETSCYTHDLHEALRRKKGKICWKVWKSKFHNKHTLSHIAHIDGVTYSDVITMKFANYF